jgi:hypothetical protein
MGAQDKPGLPLGQVGSQSNWYRMLEMLPPKSPCLSLSLGYAGAPLRDVNGSEDESGNGGESPDARR